MEHSKRKKETALTFVGPHSCEHDDYKTSCNVTPCGLVDRYQHFSETVCRHVHYFSFKSQTAISSNTVVPIYQYTRRHIEENSAVNAPRSV